MLVNKNCDVDVGWRENFLSNDLLGTSVDGLWCTGTTGTEWSTSLVDLEDVG